MKPYKITWNTGRIVFPIDAHCEYRISKRFGTTSLYIDVINDVEANKLRGLEPDKIVLRDQQ